VSGVQGESILTCKLGGEVRGHLEILGRFKVACWLVLFCGLLAQGVAHADNYKPLFDAALLEKLDPSTRERFQKLETENRKRWRNKNPIASTSAFAQAEARRHHQETEQALRRIEESRRLKQRLNASKQQQANLVVQHNRRCERLGREIAQLRRGGPIYELSEDGTRQYLSEQELKNKVKSSEKRYKEGCTG